MVFPAIEIQVEVDGQLQQLLEEPIYTNEIRIFQDAKKLYRACMNTGAIENLGVGPLLHKIRSFGGWPVLGYGNWNDLSWSWMDVSRKLIQNGFPSNYIVSVSVEPDFSNTAIRKAKVIDS
jgi:hypothetical protein